MALNLVITDAGLAEVVNAEHSGTAPVKLTAVGFGTGKYTATAAMTAMQSRFKTLSAVSGGSVGDNVIHLTVTDDSNDEYDCFEVGVYTESGTLFGIVSSSTAIIQKAQLAQAMLSIDFVLTGANPQSIVVGDITISVAPATTERQGIAELATSAETIAGTDATRVVTPAGLASLTATDARRGLAEFATAAETIAGSDGSRAVTPYGLSQLTATTERRGLMEMATDAEFNAAQDTQRAVNPSQVKTAINAHEANIASSSVLGHVKVGSGLEIDASGLLSIVFDTIYPVGSMYTTVNGSFDPNTSFGGTWERIAEGSAMMSAGSNYVAGQFYGSNTANLSVANMPAHSHTATTDTQGSHTHSRGDMNITGEFSGVGQKFLSSENAAKLTGAFYLVNTANNPADGIRIPEQDAAQRDDIFGFDASRNWVGGTSYAGAHSHNVSIRNSGSGQAFSIMQKSFAVFFWRRVE